MSIAPCTPTTPVHGVVVFEPGVFKSQFPAFGTISDGTLQFNFDVATLSLNNSCGSRVCDARERSLLLNLLVAHITALFQGANGLPPAGIVGRVNAATEGSVSVSAEFIATQASAWYLQTQWGALYWQSTGKYRQAVYIPGPPVCDGGPWGGYYGPYGPYSGY